MIVKQQKVIADLSILQFSILLLGRQPLLVFNFISVIFYSLWSLNYAIYIWTDLSRFLFDVPTINPEKWRQNRVVWSKSIEEEDEF